MTAMTGHDPQALTAHALGELSEPDARELEAHLATCAACCHEWRAIRAVVDQLGEIPPEFFTTELADPNDLLCQRIVRKIRRDKRTRLFRRYGVPLAAAAAVLIALASAFAVGRATTPTAPPTAANAAAAPGVPAAQSPVLSTEGARLVAGTSGNTTLQATLTPTGQWVRLLVTASGFPPGQRCRLMVITTNGHLEAAGSWTVPPTGEPPGGVVLAGSAAVPLWQVRAISVDTDDGRQLAYAPL